MGHPAVGGEQLLEVGMEFRVSLFLPSVSRYYNLEGDLQWITSSSGVSKDTYSFISPPNFPVQFSISFPSS